MQTDMALNKKRGFYSTTWNYFDINGRPMFTLYHIQKYINMTQKEKKLHSLNMKSELHFCLTSSAVDWNRQAWPGAQQGTTLTLCPAPPSLSLSDTTSLCPLTEALYACQTLTPPHLQYSKSHQQGVKITRRHLGARHIAKWATSLSVRQGQESGLKTSI